MISPWWFRHQLTSLIILWRILIVPPKFSYSHGNFHFMPPASCFWVFNYKKFKYHGPLVHWWIPFDRCVGSFSEVNEGEIDIVIIGRIGGFLVQKTANFWRILVQKRYKYGEILEYFLGPEISKRTKVGNVSGRYNRNFRFWSVINKNCRFLV